jgi:hypothetical protein
MTDDDLTMVAASSRIMDACNPGRQTGRRDNSLRSGFSCLSMWLIIKTVSQAPGRVRRITIWFKGTSAVHQLPVIANNVWV